MDCSPPVSSVHGNSQARTLEWVAVSSSRDLPDPGRMESLSPALQVDSLPLSHLGNLFSRAPIDLQGFLGGSVGKESACNAGHSGSIPGSRSSPGGGNGNPLQCSCPGNPTDRGVWWATVHRVSKSQTWLKQLGTHTSIHPLPVKKILHFSELHLHMSILF